MDSLVQNYTNCSDYYFYSNYKANEKDLVVSPEDFAVFLLSYTPFKKHLNKQLKLFASTGRFVIFPNSFDFTAFLMRAAKKHPNYSSIRKQIKDKIEKAEKERKSKISYILDVQKLEKAGYTVIPPKSKNTT